MKTYHLKAILPSLPPKMPDNIITETRVRSQTLPSI